MSPEQLTEAGQVDDGQYLGSGVILSSFGTPVSRRQPAWLFLAISIKVRQSSPGCPGLPAPLVNATSAA
jgi:hypothetical protein